MAESLANPFYLSNPFYAALHKAQASFAIANGDALRYAPQYIPMAAVREPTAPALADLRDLLSPGEAVFLTTGPGQTLPPCAGLEQTYALPALQMAFAGKPPAQMAFASKPPAAPDSNMPPVLRLGHADAADMLALKAVAFPGYVGPHFYELGDFFGIRDPASGELVAMAGERLCTHTHRELSAVCTHPAHLGNGYAARLIGAVLHAQAERGAQSILQVLAGNARAIALYERIGFRTTGKIRFHRVFRENSTPTHP